MTQEFHISVTPLGDDDYLVRIERVAPGVALAEEQIHWPVENWLQQARQLMNDPLLGVLQGNALLQEDSFVFPMAGKSASPSANNLVALGQQLYEALFQGSLRDSWMMAQAIAQNQRSVLRLRLGLKGNRLPRLPWEVLYAGDRPLATGTDIAFSRYQLSTKLMSPSQTLVFEQNQPLKILMVIAGPSDQEILELAQEAAQLQEELKSRSPEEPPAIQLTILEQPGREQLTQALEQGRYQVFHYAGHSNLGDSGGNVYLVSGRTGLTETLNGDDLAGLLANNGVQLAVFNSCRGAYTAASSADDNGKERNLAKALVKRGIPAVLAMAERIPDEVALTLTRLLYRNLNQGYPIDLSLSRARQGLISAYGSNQLYWALPVLYLHQDWDGFLSNVEAAMQGREARLSLGAPAQMLLADEVEDALFTTPPLLNDLLSDRHFLDEEEEFVLPTDADATDYSEEALNSFLDELEAEDLEGDDPADFIKDLLGQLNQESEPPTLVPSEAVNSNLTHRPPSPAVPAQTAEVPLPTVQVSPPTSPAKAQQSDRRSPLGRGRSWQQQFLKIPRRALILGATSVLGIAVLGWWIAQNQRPNPSDLLPLDASAPVERVNPLNFSKTNTATLTATAIEQFSRGDLGTGQQAVEELLNRGALGPAEAALAVVPPQQIDHPEISFLKGRLAWQAVQAGSKDYAVGDARRYWETANQKQANSSKYLNALGFAYYVEGNYDRANQAWFDALYSLEEQQVAAIKTGKTPTTETLTIYAGLALGLRQLAQKQPTEKQEHLLDESFKLRQKVLSEDPINFQPDALSQRWIWPETAIADWRSLLATSAE
ncbi:MAG: CHAT domain-containing protein [Kastovskya adunca ATA6-11-RM4]|nr:CHAT domain-containing protein [Kastovskya adunca ATA6-11-RM4]